jgi:hypothetical protein
LPGDKCCSLFSLISGEEKKFDNILSRLFLKEFCIEFLHGAYNNLMFVVKVWSVLFYFTSFSFREEAPTSNV